MTSPTTTPTLETHASAMAAWRRRRRAACRTILAPRSRLSVSEWAERRRRLSGDNTSQAGPYRYAQAPYLREIADSISDPTVEEIVVLKSAQVGYTEGVIGNAVGWVIDEDPSPMLVMQPVEDDAERWSKKKFMPMVRASPALRKKVAEGRPGDARNTILLKSGPGWSLSIVGAKSPRKMRSDSIRYFFADERSGYDKSAGEEGDPYLLGKKRTTTFDNRKLVTGSTPTIAPDETEKAYLNSDQRRYEVPCPHCGEYQELQWENLRWEKEGDGPEKVHRPETAHFVCAVHGCVIEERHKRRMVRAGRWVARNPGHPIRGYFIWQAYSLFPKAAWSIIAQEWLDAQGDPEKLKIFFNTVLAQSFEERGERPDAEGLEARREVFRAPVPMGAAVLTAAIDVQKDRLELLIVGWGAGEECWLVAHYRIMGDPEEDAVWDAADRLLLTRYLHESGHQLQVQACGVDTGDGNSSGRVYDWVKPRQRRGVFALKGDEGIGKPVLIRTGKAKTPGVKLWRIGTHTAKVRLFSRLRIDPPKPGEPARPGAIHIPLAQENGLDAAALRQFANEKMLPKKLPNGRVVSVFKKTGPNEMIDLYVYALAALHFLGDGVRNFLGTLAERLKATAPAAPAPTEGVAAALPAIAEVLAAPAPVAVAAPPRRRGRRVRSRGVD